MFFSNKTNTIKRPAQKTNTILKSRDDLFQLIKAMSRSEKRYFVLDAKKSGRSASRYLKLFDTINGMDEADGAKLKKKFPKNLSSDKAYLYESILRSMRDYRSTSSKAAQVKERLLDARYLHERGLYAQSNGRIMEAKRLATELEDNFSLLEIVREEQLSLYDRRVKVGIEQVEELQREKQAALMRVKEELDYIGLYFRLAVEVYGKGVLRDEKSISDLRGKLPIGLLDREDLPHSPLAQRRYFLSLASYHRLLGDKQQIYLNYEKAVKWWDGYPELKGEEFYRYVGDVTNLVNACYMDIKLLPIAKYWFQKLQNEGKGKNHHEKKYIFQSLSVANLLHLMNMEDMEGTRAALPNIISGLEEFGLKRSVLILANIVIAYFWMQDYANCEKWSSLLISLKGNSREDVRRVVMLFRLVSLYEQGKVDEVDAGLRAANRFYKNHSVAKSNFDSMLLNHFLKRIFHAPLNEQKTVLHEFGAYLEMVEKDTTEKPPLGLGEFKLWVTQQTDVYRYSAALTR